MPPGRRASWLDEELSQPESFGCQLIDARRRCPTQLAAAVNADVAVTEVVGKEEADVGLFVLCGGRGGRQADSRHDHQRDEGSQCHSPSGIDAKASAPGWGRPLGHQYAPVTRSLARVTVPLPLDLVQYLREVVARRILHRRERHIWREPLEPKQLADGRAFPAVEIRGTRGRKGTRRSQQRPAVGADVRLARMAPGGLELSPRD